MHWVEILGYAGALLTLGTYSMKRMIPLRVVGICANCVFIAYGLLVPVYPQLMLHIVLLPLNAIRLREMLQLIGKVKAASQGDLNMDWLKPFMAKRSAKQGEVLFHKGELSSAMFFTVTGRYRLNEVIGEIGLIAPDNKWTLTFECVDGWRTAHHQLWRGQTALFSKPQVRFLFPAVDQPETVRRYRAFAAAAGPSDMTVAISCYPGCSSGESFVRFPGLRELVLGTFRFGSAPRSREP
jgi:hypothetical protein